MTSCSHCGCPLPVVPPERVVAYLEGKGWRRIMATGSIALPYTAIWRLGEHHDVEVPMGVSARDYPRRFLELLADLRRIEGRSMAEIAEEMGSQETPAR